MVQHMASIDPTMMARDPRQVGAALRRARRAQKLTQAALARKAGVTQATISLLEGGMDGVKLRTITDVMAALGLEFMIGPRATGGDGTGLF